MANDFVRHPGKIGRMSIDKDQLLAHLAHSHSDAEIGELDLQVRPRGLADRDAIEALAQTYLEEQSKHWPQLVGSDLIPANSAQNIAAMASHFESVYIRGNLPVFENKGLPAGVDVGAAYMRYSDYNSNPRSLNQQLINALRGAARDGIFVPWEYVFADAAKTGTNEHRRGYQLVKQLIPRAMSPIRTVYLDELGRASRDQIESLNLGRLIENTGKRLVGVTDGFDSSNAMSKMMLSIYAMIHEMFVDQLREKVDRGMKDAFNQGRPLYQPGYGYSLVPILGDDSNPVQTGDGKIVQQIMINEEEAAQVQRIFSLFVDEMQSPQRISRLLNQEQVGKRSWTGTQVRNMLSRSMYVGREPWGKTTRQVDTESGEVKTVKLPEDEWQWRDMPHLRIISQDQWQAVQDRLAELSRAYDPKDKSVSRGEANSKRLFHLVCGHCGSQMWSNHGGDRQVVGCYKGRDGAGGCTAHASKTVKQIEESLLNHILEQLSSETFVDEFLTAANAALVEIASEPVVNVEPLRQQLSKKEAARVRLARKLESVEDDQLLDQVFATVAKLEREIIDLKETISRSNVDKSSLAPICRDNFATLIGSLWELLYEDVSLAGSVLAAITGPIRLRQGDPLPGKRRPQWTAEFTLNHAKVFVEIARQRNCPSTDTWEFLASRSWTFGEAATVGIRMFTNAERIAKSAAEMVLAGSTHAMAAVALMVDKETVDTALRHWEAGQRCYLPPKDLTFRRDLPASKVAVLADKVVRLVEEENLSFIAIASKLETTPNVVSRSYKQSKLNQTIALAKEGKTLSIPPRLKLPAEVHARIRELLVAGGMSYREIARQVGCNHHAVSDAHVRMKKVNAT